jgi:hypothetical protein
MTNSEASNEAQTATVAEQGAHVAPEKASSKKGATQKKGAPRARKVAKEAKLANKKAAKKGAKAVSKPASKRKQAAEARQGSKKAIILELLRRPKGATVAEIAKATGWQNHSIRGFISGQLTKRMGLTVESSKNIAGQRTYRLVK